MKSDCLGCAVLLCLVVCLTLLASSKEASKLNPNVLSNAKQLISLIHGTVTTLHGHCRVSTGYPYVSYFQVNIITSDVFSSTYMCTVYSELYGFNYPYQDSVHYWNSTLVASSQIITPLSSIL